MAPDKIKVNNDPRISLRSALVNGYTYGYLYSPRSTSVANRGTIVLVHGFPDISMGWRYQIPMLTGLGLDVIAIDCIGYGRTSAPASSHISAYGFKRVSDDIAALCAQLGLTSIVLGGHDWGGAIVYRVQQYYPQLIQAFFAICTPYFAPTPVYQPLALVVETQLPNFRYQLHLASGQLEDAVQSRAELRHFLSGMYGGRTPDNNFLFRAEEGILLQHLAQIGASPLLSPEETEYYVNEYARNGMNGPLNWYRTREQNYLDDLAHFFPSQSGGGAGADTPADKVEEIIKIKDVEVLFVQAAKDGALKPFMAKKMDERIERLTWKHVDAGHWCLWEKPDECNRLIADWLEEKVFGKGAESKSRL